MNGKVQRGRSTCTLNPLAAKKSHASATKRCTRCGTSRPLDEFPAMKRMRDGRSSWCRPCAALANRRWRAENPDYVAQANASRRITHPPKPCHGCGLEFVPVRVDSRFCCPDCYLGWRANGGTLSPAGAVAHVRRYHPGAPMT
jgi:hypothetical protein